jgi:hypothetical protein
MPTESNVGRGEYAVLHPCRYWHVWGLGGVDPADPVLLPLQWGHGFVQGPR